MPNIGIHLLVAQRVLDRWSTAGADPPFPLSDREAVSAFFHGSILPDAGYLPRGDRLFSELAHLTRTADLLRAQLQEAASPPQLAHAWGWATHVLADLAIHPLINQAQGELLSGGPSRVVTSTEGETGHMRLEFGLDAAVFRAFPQLDSLDPGMLPKLASLAPICHAFARIHAWRLAPSSIRNALGVAARMARLNRQIHRARSADFRRNPIFRLLRVGARAVAPPKRWMPGRWNQSGAVQGILSPINPPAWLFETAVERVENVALQLDQERDARFAGLVNHDLTTGLPESDTEPTERARSALAMLNARQNRARAGTGSQ